MAPKTAALNGCGRIGRLAFRLAWEKPEALQITHLNDITAIEVRRGAAGRRVPPRAPGGHDAASGHQHCALT